MFLLCICLQENFYASPQSLTKVSNPLASIIQIQSALDGETDTFLKISTQIRSHLLHKPVPTPPTLTLHTAPPSGSALPACTELGR